MLTLQRNWLCYSLAKVSRIFTDSTKLTGIWCELKMLLARLSHNNLIQIIQKIYIVYNIWSITQFIEESKWNSLIGKHNPQYIQQHCFLVIIGHGLCKNFLVNKNITFYMIAITTNNGIRYHKNELYELLVYSR